MESGRPRVHSQMATELLVAIKAHKKLHCSQQDGVTAANVPKFSGSSYSGTRLHVFVQIWLGLICLPVYIFLLITPLQTNSVVCATVVILASIVATVMCLLYNWKISVMLEVVNLEEIVATFHDALVAAVDTLYFYLLPQGTSISSTIWE